jgi:hypothetical protein
MWFLHNVHIHPCGFLTMYISIHAIHTHTYGGKSYCWTVEQHSGQYFFFIIWLLDKLFFKYVVL